MALEKIEEKPLHVHDLSRPDDRVIFTTWRQWQANGQPLDVQGAFYDTLDESLQDRVDILVRFQKDQPEVPYDLLRDKVLDAITQLRIRNLRRQNQELRFLQEEAQASGDREAFRHYGQLTIEIAARIRRLQQAVNERSLAGRRQQVDAVVRVPFSEE
jgi:hypothetical protein